MSAYRAEKEKDKSERAAQNSLCNRIIYEKWSREKA
jgi:hypothetical protein